MRETTEQALSTTPVVEPSASLTVTDEKTTSNLEIKSSVKNLPILSTTALTIGDSITSENTLSLHRATYQQQPVTVQQVTPSLLREQHDALSAFTYSRSPFWLPIVGVCEGINPPAFVMSALPETRFDAWLASPASASWDQRCRLVRDVAVGLYQRRVVGAATHVSWDIRQLYLDKDGRAQLMPLLGETSLTEADEVFTLGQVIWQVVSRKTELANGWQQGKGLPHDCPPAVIALIKDCANPLASARPSLKALAKGLDAFWQRAERGLPDATPAVPTSLSKAEKDNKYELPTPQLSSRSAQQIEDLLTALPSSQASLATSATTSVSQSLMDSVLASGSLNLLLIDDQTVSWLSATDPRYQVGVKLCGLRDGLAQPTESKASQPKLQTEIQYMLVDPSSQVDMLLWVGEGCRCSCIYNNRMWRY